MPQNRLFGFGSPHPFWARRLVLVMTLGAGILLSGSAAGAALSTGYITKDKISAGSLVILDNKEAKTVALAGADRADDLLGVVVPADQALLNVSSGTQEVQVAIDGQVEALVSTERGDIAPGDRVAISGIRGVGAKATEIGRVVGVAQGTFSESSQGATKQEVTFADGQKKEVTIGKLPVLVSVTTYTPPALQDRTQVPKFLSIFADSVAGKKVPQSKIYAGVAVTILALVTVTILLYGAVKSSIISIGRNPLSKHSIQASLLQVLAISAGILLLAFGVIYVIFRA